MPNPDRMFSDYSYEDKPKAKLHPALDGIGQVVIILFFLVLIAALGYMLFSAMTGSDRGKTADDYDDQPSCRYVLDEYVCDE